MGSDSTLDKTPADWSNEYHQRSIRVAFVSATLLGSLRPGQRNIIN